MPRPRVFPTEPLPLPADQEAEEFPIAPRYSHEPSLVQGRRGVMRRLEGRQASPPRGDGPWRNSADTLAKEWEAQRRQTAAQGRNRRVGEWHASVVRRAAGELWKCQKMWADAGRAALFEDDVEAGQVKEWSRGEPRLVRRGQCRALPCPRSGTQVRLDGGPPRGQSTYTMSWIFGAGSSTKGVRTNTLLHCHVRKGVHGICRSACPRRPHYPRWLGLLP